MRAEKAGVLVGGKPAINFAENERLVHRGNKKSDSWTDRLFIDSFLINSKCL
jgi:hypothetical protein